MISIKSYVFLDDLLKRDQGFLGIMKQILKSIIPIFLVAYKSTKEWTSSVAFTESAAMAMTW